VGRQAGRRADANEGGHAGERVDQRAAEICVGASKAIT
jgi:hypothetical protein